jgi:CRP-like cAMP-binding protein
MDENKHYSPLMDVENVLTILNKISIFAGLSDKQLYVLFRQLEEVSYQAGEYIFQQGDQPSHIYIVRTGKVKLVVTDGQTPLELIEFDQGHCFGETAVIGILPHEASSIAAENTRLIVLSRSALLSLYKSDIELFCILILNIAREACRRLHQTDEILLHYVLDK